MQSFEGFKIEVSVPAKIKINTDITSNLLKNATDALSSSSSFMRMSDMPIGRDFGMRRLKWQRRNEERFGSRLL